MTDQNQPQPPASCVLFCCEQMEPMARRIVKLDPSIILGGVNWQRFGDKYPETEISKQRGIHQMRVAFLASLEEPKFIFEQLGAAMTIAGYGPSRFQFLLPFFPPGFMDRAVNEGQVVSADILAQMISLLPANCRPEVVLYDIHALQIKHFFEKHVLVRLKSALKYFFPILEQLGDVSVCFPDYGARNRFAPFFGKYPHIECAKVRRPGGGRDIKIVDGDPRGRHVVIVDDAFMTCGTTRVCRKVLVEAGAAKVSAFATHGRFPEDSWQTLLGEGFETVWLTDSCPEQAALVAGKPPFQVISLAESLARVILDRDGM